MAAYLLQQIRDLGILLNGRTIDAHTAFANDGNVGLLHVGQLAVLQYVPQVLRPLGMFALGARYRHCLVSGCGLIEGASELLRLLGKCHAGRVATNWVGGLLHTVAQAKGAQHCRPTTVLWTNCNFEITASTGLNLKSINVDTPMMNKGQVTYRVQMEKEVGANAIRNRIPSDIMHSRSQNIPDSSVNECGR